MPESRIASLTSDPLLQQFAVDASQRAIRPIARFLAPLVEVPDASFHYKIYDAKNRYKPAHTKRAPGGKATRIGFTAADGFVTLDGNALDFPVPNPAGMSDDMLRNYIQYGTQLLADAGALAHEEEVVNTAIAAAGAGTGYDFTSASVDPIAILDAALLSTIKTARNGAPVKVLFGTTIFKELRSNANTLKRFVVGARNGIVAPSIADLSGLLMTNPEVQLSMFVIDTAAEGVAENIQFLLDTSILVFASNDTPNIVRKVANTNGPQYGVAALQTIQL